MQTDLGHVVRRQADKRETAINLLGLSLRSHINIHALTRFCAGGRGRILLNRAHDLGLEVDENGLRPNALDVTTLMQSLVREKVEQRHTSALWDEYTDATGGSQ